MVVIGVCFFFSFSRMGLLLVFSWMVMVVGFGVFVGVGVICVRVGVVYSMVV